MNTHTYAPPTLVLDTYVGSLALLHCISCENVILFACSECVWPFFFFTVNCRILREIVQRHSLLFELQWMWVNERVMSQRSKPRKIEIRSTKIDVFKISYVIRTILGEWYMFAVSWIRVKAKQTHTNTNFQTAKAFTYRLWIREKNKKIIWEWVLLGIWILICKNVNP